MEQQEQTTQKKKMTIASHHLRHTNKMRRDEAIMEEFNKHDARYIPITVIWREFIYPKFFISRQTLYRIFKDYY
jgi:hypothetical protein